MKFQSATALLALGVSAVHAQMNQTGPFLMHIKGTEPGSTIDGYGSGCHIGAALEALCYSSGPAPTGDEAASYSFYFNYTDENKDGDLQVGGLIFNLPINPPLSSGMSLWYQSHSNMASPTFSPNSGSFSTGFDEDNKWFGWSYYDDATFKPRDPPELGNGTIDYDWYVCWQYFSGYYYNSVGWSLYGAPKNPTCEHVEITRVML
jgi:hypothetical protein